VSQDILEGDRKHLERISELEFKVKWLEKQNKQYSETLKTVAHDLKNPLSSIFGIASLMLADDDRSEEDVEMLELVTESVNSLTRTINDLLIFNIDLKSDLERVETDIEELLSHSVNLLRFRANEKQQTIVLDIKSKGTAFINRDSIWRVLNNLIVNSIKFSPQGSQITVSVEVSKDVIQISVKDQGIGIPKEIAPDLFKFTTAGNRNGTDGEESFGLGLYICKKILDDHQGKIWFDSIEDVETTFYILLLSSN
jgi:signal transduction histidine kinase